MIAWMDKAIRAGVEWFFEVLRISNDDTDSNIW